MAMLLPLFPDDFLCYLTGVSKMTAKRFIWIILLGKPWCILAYSLGFSLIKWGEQRYGSKAKIIRVL